MTGYVVSPLARQDIFNIVDYIAADNSDAAFRLRDRLFMAFVRFWPVGASLVIYRPAKPMIQIVRVLSGYRNMATMLDPTQD